jgi:exonuclease III
LNSDKHQRALRSKIEESQCSIICVQETKCEVIDHKLIRNCCPKRFDSFVYSPSVGASGGILVLWNSAVFSGSLVELQRYGVIVNFTSVHSGESWNLVSVYGPCQGELRDDFVNWLYNLHIPTGSNWLLLGDFNFIRSSDNRNKPGGDVNDMFLFNEVIGQLGLLELPLKGRKYTWSNMQNQPLLEQLDWFFTSAEWISTYPNTVVLPLANTASDHIPCVVNIDTVIPKANIFRFENFWTEQPGFMDCVKEVWNSRSNKAYSSAVLVDKFKSLRYALKKWHTSLSKLKINIQNCNKVILLLDTLEEQRPLFLTELNFRQIVKLHLENLLLVECNYWRKRCTIRWVKVGEDNTKFFHAMATQRHRRNAISMLTATDGRQVTDHEEMAGLLWSSYKERMGRTEGICMQFYLASLLTKV